MTHEIIHGDCLEVMRTMDADSVHAIVTDPPYGLSFMGKDWDHGIPGVAFWTEALRVAKPGAHLLAFGGTRTFHRLTCAIEDAGWEVRDCLMWLYGSGFPKSLDISKAIDKAAGEWRGRAGAMISKNGSMSAPNYERTPKGDPVTAAAAAWSGWGTALKPAWEPIILARKPIAGTVAANVLKHGCGGLNIEGCRVGFASASDEAESKGKNQHTRYANPSSNRDSYSGSMPPRTDYDASGRWPANVMHDGSDEVLAGFPNTTSGKMAPTHTNAQRRVFGANADGGYTTMETYGDSGSAARFFYCSKASKRDRDEGLEGMPTRARPTMGSGIGAQPNQNIENYRNHHPTVKPTDLMRYLCRLVTPPTGTVLDPFCGSGSTGKAAVLEGFNFIGIEREAEYVAIARARIAGANADSPLFTA